MIREGIIAKREVPELPEGVKIHYVKCGDFPRKEAADISEADFRDMVEKIRVGQYLSVELSLDEYNEESYLLMESSPDLIFLQIWYGETGTVWACFNPNYLDSDEEASIEPSDGQSVFPMKCTMRDRELAAKCVEWYVHTLEPYPGMDWLKMTW